MTATGVDESFTGLLQFAGGVVGTVHSSFRTPYRTWLEVVGEQGALSVARPFKPESSEVIEIRRGDDCRQEIVEGSSLLFLRQVDDFVAATLDGRAPAVSLKESRGNAAVLAALHTSARTGQAVTL
jgi:predicted dehydrogenase